MKRPSLLSVLTVIFLILIFFCFYQCGKSLNKTSKEIENKGLKNILTDIWEGKKK